MLAIQAKEAVSAFLRYYELMLQYGARPEAALGRLKQLAARLCKGISPAYPEFRQDLLVSQTVEAFFARAEKFINFESEGKIFEPERLLNLNGKASETIEFGQQFKR